MRTSSKRTTVAVLRSILGIKDVGMAELLGCSPATIHSLESGRLPLSEEMAAKIVHETQISQRWLLAANPTAVPVAENGEPYTSAVYEHAQAEKLLRDRPTEWSLVNETLSYCGQLAGILASASERGVMASFKVRRFLDMMRDEFGLAPRHFQTHAMNPGSPVSPAPQLFPSWADAAGQDAALLAEVANRGLLLMEVPPSPRSKRQRRREK